MFEETCHSYISSAAWNDEIVYNIFFFPAFQFSINIFPILPAADVQRRVFIKSSPGCNHAVV